MKRKLITRLWMLFLAFALLASPVSAVNARSWMLADLRNYVIAQACTDGVIVVMIHAQSIDPAFYPGLLDTPPWVNMGVRKITDNTAPPPEYKGNLIVPPTAYGPVELVPLQKRYMTYHSVPLPVDNEGSGVSSYHIYAFHKLTWPQGLVQVGEQVLVVGQSWISPYTNYSGMLASAENCRVNQFSYPIQASLHIDRAHFSRFAPHLGALLPLFHTSQPAFGQVTVNHAAPTDPFLFSQQDINMGSVTYTPNPPGSTAKKDMMSLRAVNLVQTSIDSNGVEGNNESTAPSISQNGRFVTFTSLAANLPGGDGIINQIYLHDRDADGNGIYDEPGAGSTTVLVSTGTNGKANNNSWGSNVSADGHSVAFYSLADNLVPNDTNSANDIFVRSNNIATRISVTSAGIQANGNSSATVMSENGRFVVFSSDATNLDASTTTVFSRIYLHDRDTDVNGVFDEPGKISTVLVSKDSLGSPINDNSFNPSISANGRYVVFETPANNVVPGETNGQLDVFLFDTATQQTELISVYAGDPLSSGNSFSNTGHVISDDGRYVVFRSDARGMAPNFIDAGTFSDIFVRDRSSQQTRPVTYNFIHSNAGNDDSWAPSISGSGRFIAFASSANDLLPLDAPACQVAGLPANCVDIFAFDQEGKNTVLLSVDANLAQANGNSDQPVISSDGSFVTFSSHGDNLVPGVIDTNGASDIFTAYVGFPFILPILGENRTFLPVIHR